MNATKVLTIVVLTYSLTLCSTRGSTFDWATIENPGNPGETQPGGTFGAVDYSYRISKHEVTNGDYTEFLNAVDPTGVNDLALYNPGMTTDPMGGILFSDGAVDGSKYEIKPGRANNPVVFVSMFDAMRFVNWLENGQGSGETEVGTYTISDGKSEVRTEDATYFLPSEDEWYKAAYHKNDGPTGNYWDYPTSTDVLPYSDQPPGLDAPDITNVVNMYLDDGLDNGYNDGSAVTGVPGPLRIQNYLTDVGEYFASVSPYGTFDQGGNVWELMEVVTEGASPLVNRGGSALGTPQLHASSKYRIGHSNPNNETRNAGFRIAAAIPEPMSIVLSILATSFVLSRSYQKDYLTRSLASSVD